MDFEALVERFRTLGARDPESWARSQVEEGIPQLARFVFLKGAWDNVHADGDVEWIHRLLEATAPDADGPFDGVAHAIRRLDATGADRHDVAELYRNAQVQMMFDLCYLLSDPGVVHDRGDVDWQLMRIDVGGVAVEPMDGLHESVLETDPSGREMRPRPMDG